MGGSGINMITEALLRRREKMPRTVEAMREEFERVMAMFPMDPAVSREETKAGGVHAEWFTPPNVIPGRVMYYLHGGGYIIGSTETHASLIGEFAKVCQARCLAINYRLAPDHKHPAPVDDALAGYRWLLEQRVQPGQLVVAGDSAGGGLALALLVAARDEGLPLPAAGVCLSPWTDLAGTGESLDTRGHLDPMLDKRGVVTFARMILDDQDPKHPLASPLYADLRGLPPLLIHVGGKEILYDDAVRLAERARAAGVDVTLEIWDEMIHIFHIYSALLDEARDAVQKVGHFVHEKLG